MKDKKTVYNIYSFAQIGWTDPFPKPLLEGEFNSEPSISDNTATQYIDNASKRNNEILGKDFLYQEKKFKVEQEGAPPEEINLIYCKERYTKEYSPMTVYIPTKDIMFKLMRGCLGCQNVEDLWIFHEDYTKL